MFNEKYYSEKWIEAQGEVESLKERVRELSNSMHIQTGPFDNGFAPCERWDANTIKLKFEQIYEFLGVKLEKTDEKLVKIKP